MKLARSSLSDVNLFQCASTQFAMRVSAVGISGHRAAERAGIEKASRDKAARRG